MDLVSRILDRAPCPLSLSNIILPPPDQSCPPQIQARAGRDVTDGEVRSIAAVLAEVTDPRKARGRRHGGFGLLMGVRSAVLAGARSTVQIAEHVQDLSTVQRARIGLAWPVPPSLSTLRRFLVILEEVVLQEALNVWAQAHAARIAALTQSLRHFAVDGKSQRGAATKGCPKPHLMGVLDVGAGLFLPPLSVEAKTNEISMFAATLDQIADIESVATAGIVLVTADAMHCQTGHATYLHGRGAGLLVGLKRNQPTEFDQAAALPWNQIPVADTEVTPRLHGRVDKRVVKVTAIGRHDEAIAFENARQVAQVTRYEQRRTRTPGRWYWKKIKVDYYLCTFDQVRLPAQQLARAVKNHWTVEAWHWLRDVTLGEDAHPARTGHNAANLAALRNTVISVLHLDSTTQIARTLRRLARNPEHAITLLTSTNPTLN